MDVIVATGAVASNVNEAVEAADKLSAPSIWYI